MKYESDILKRLIKTYGVVGNPRYISEIIKEFIVQGKECYPDLFTYQADWLAHIDEFGLTPEYTVSYTGQQIYAPHTKERPVKRAILKGKTILWDNIENKETSNISLWVEGNYSINESTGEINTSTSDVITYFVEIPSNLVYINGTATWKKIFYYDEGLNFISSQRTNSSSVKLVTDIPVNAIYMRLQYYKSSDNLTLYPTDSYDNEIVLTRNISINTVKMPVLTTTGKNLFDGEIEEGQFDSNGKPSNYVGRTRCKNFIKVPKNTDLYISIGGANNASWTTIYFYNDKKEHTETFNTMDVNKTFNTGNNSYIKWKNNTPMSQITNIQIEQGSVATSYEPYKTNILTVNEDVTLRSNGSVCDELDLLTGKLTQRIDEDGEILAQEVVKTVGLTIHDKDQQKVERLASFEGGTHFTTSSQEGSLLPSLTVDVVTNLEETLNLCSTDGNTL